MYCSSCGVAITQNLTYCNYCGAKLIGTKSDVATKSTEVKPEILVAAMVFVFVFGLGAIGFLLGILKAVLDVYVGQILAIALLCFLILVSLEAVFIRLLFRRKRDGEENDVAPAKGQVTKELEAAQARALPEPVPSVTEHTTRTFAPVFDERASK